MRMGFTRLFVLFMSLIVVSCSTSKFQNGFVYRPAQEGPGFSGNMTEETATHPQKESVADIAAATNKPFHAPANGINTPEPADMLTSVPVNGEVNADLAILSRLVQEQAYSTPNAGPLKPEQLLRELASGYAAEKQLTLSDKQLRKLDRYAAKLEKKQQKLADVDWAPRNNLEIFVLAAAGVGIIVGLFAGIGWFVFILAALAYLYLKLLA
jgi:hypothetical protein